MRPQALSPVGRALIRPSVMPIRTTLEGFYKIGPGPSSSYTMGPMRITSDFHRRVAALPAITGGQEAGVVRFIDQMAMTARDMSRKYKETSEAGLAALVLC